MYSASASISRATGCFIRKLFSRSPRLLPSRGKSTSRWSSTTPTLTSPPLSGIHQLHQPSPMMWLVAVPRVPYTADAHSGYFSASSRPSQSLTPFHRDHAAAVGCSVLARHQPSCRARTAARPDASTTQRALTGKRRPSCFTSIVCPPPGMRRTLETVAGRKTVAPAAAARRSTSSSNAARSS